MNAHCETLNSASHIYVFVSLKGNQRPYFLVVSSPVVAANVVKEVTTNGTWYSFMRDTKWEHTGEGWEEAFGNPTPALGPADGAVAPDSAQQVS